MESKAYGFFRLRRPSENAAHRDALRQSGPYPRILFDCISNPHLVRGGCNDANDADILCLLDWSNTHLRRLEAAVVMFLPYRNYT
jgi:hypothetical protein